MNYYQFHIADWALHTAHLTLEEDGVYRRLLDYYYDTESPIPEKTQPVIRRLRLSNHAEIVEQILQEFFVLEADGWHNLRADKEISVYNAKAEQARANGKRGGRPKKNKGLREEKPTETQPVICGNQQESESKANQEPITKNQEPIKTYCLAGLPGVADDVKRLADCTADEVADAVIDALNHFAGKSFKYTAANRKFIKGRLSDGYTPQDCLLVITSQVAKWKGGPWDKFLRPETLFNATKFESYLNDNGADYPPAGSAQPRKQFPGREGSTRGTSLTQDLTDTSWAN